jgi:mRNA interferase MazF
VKRGEIWWANAGEPSGSAPGYRHPVLIVSANSFNDSAIRTVIAVFLTTSEARGSDPGNVRILPRDSGLRKVSYANVTQIMTFDRRILSAKAGRIPDRVLTQVDDGLRLVLAL